MNTSGTLLLVLFVALGALAGRFPKLLVLVVAPVVAMWVWYDRNHGGPGDDVTGPVAALAAALGVVVFLAAAALTWLGRRAWSRSRSDSA